MFLRIDMKCFAAVAMGFAAAIAAPPALADEAAEQYVAAILLEAEPALMSPDEAVRFNGIARLVDKYVDMRRIGMFSLGQYARQMTAAQRQEYLALFERYATDIYQDILSDYSGQALKVVGSVVRSERDIIVNSRVADPRPGSEFAKVTVHWRVYRDRQGAMSIVDAGADQVWLAIEQRGEFTSVIANNGGGSQGIDVLIAELRARLGD